MNQPNDPFTMWFVDDDEPMQRNLAALAGGLVTPGAIRTFSRAGEAAACVRAGESNALLPALVSTDMVGADPGVDNGPSLLEVLHKEAPLTFVVLHSRRAGPDTPLVKDLLNRRLLHRCIPKGNPDTLREVLRTCLERWNRPTLRHLREYISRCSDPATPFASDGHGGFLSLLDLYQEILLGTPTGEEAELVWSSILSETDKT